MPTEDDFSGTGYFKGTDAKISASHTNWNPNTGEFWTPERKKVDLQFLLVGMAAVALLVYYGRK